MGGAILKDLWNKVFPGDTLIKFPVPVDTFEIGIELLLLHEVSIIYVSREIAKSLELTHTSAAGGSRDTPKNACYGWRNCHNMKLSTNAGM
jgi:hypothetical protein